MVMGKIDNPKNIIESLKYAIEMEENSVVNYTRYAKEAENTDAGEIAGIFHSYAIAAEKHAEVLKNVLREQELR